MKAIFLVLIIGILALGCVKTDGKIGGGQTQQCICTQEYDPVCGNNGKTYSNSCFAQCAGTTWQSGSC